MLYLLINFFKTKCSYLPEFCLAKIYKMPQLSKKVNNLGLYCVTYYPFLPILNHKDLFKWLQLESHQFYLYSLVCYTMPVHNNNLSWTLDLTK